MLMAMLSSSEYCAAQEIDEKGIYIALRGYGAIEDENNLVFDNSYEIAAAIGIRRHSNWRVEAEYGYRHSDIVGLNGATEITGENSLKSIGLHVFYDFRNNKKLRPFLGVGAGVQSRDISFSGVAQNDPDFEVFANDSYSNLYGNAFIGTSYHINKNLRISVGGEYVTGRDRSITANYRELPGINRSYNYYVGARWFFPQ